ncbi:MAG: mRNA surveillance protein pelota [uncultured DHVE6 group euryarchaeote]|jgi:protein pelota|nr:MAG: mRNA surveillance protein pelota [uncultured DHVE6 group euryarchaeote]
MIVQNLDQKNSRLSVRIDSLDDLVFLKQIIESGDFVTGRTYRKIKLGDEGSRQRSIKKSVKIKLRVDKLAFDRFLRIHGTVETEIEGIAMHSAHSIEVGMGTELEIEKEGWKKYQLTLIKNAEEASKAPKALICVLDDEQASFAHITSSGYTKLGRISLRLSKKRYEEQKNQGYKDIQRVAKEIDSKFNDRKVEMIILGSPLFWKEIVKKQLDEDFPETSKKVHLKDVSSGDEDGIRELISGNALDKIIKNSQLSREEDLVNEVLSQLAKNSKLIIYGVKNVEAAAESGAVESILISESRLDGSEKIKELIDNVENSGGTVNLISSSSPAGKKLNGLKGIIAKLRYNLE